MICVSCNSKLFEFAEFQQELIALQTNLYKYVNQIPIEEDSLAQVKLENVECKLEPEELCEVDLEIPIYEQRVKLKTFSRRRQAERQWECDICHKSFKSKSLLRHHMKEHSSKPDSDSRRRMCQLCGLSLAKSGWFHHILRVHTESVRFVCDFCSKGFRVKHDLKKHIQTHMNVESRMKYPCNFCNVSLLSKHALKTHEQLYHSTTLEEFPCECGKVFGTKTKLNYHRTTIHIKGHFQCSKCSNVYKNNGALKKHFIKHHSNNIPCDFCGEMFPPGTLMNNHMKIHGPATIKCTFEACKAKFHSKSGLSFHIESQHNPANNVSCTTCSASFNSVRNLKRHIARQHESKRLQCEIDGCTFTATRKDSFYIHYRSIKSHKELDEETRNLLCSKVKESKSFSW